MKIRKYVFPLAVAVLTFAFGMSVYTSVRMAASLLSSLVGKEDVVAQPVDITPMREIEIDEPESVVVGLEEDVPEVAATEPEEEFDPSGIYYMPENARSKRVRRCGKP